MNRMESSKVPKRDFINSDKALDIVLVAQDHIKMVSMILFLSKIVANPELPTATFADPKNKENMT